VTAVELTATPAPASHAERVSTITTSKAILHYDDGSTSEHPLAYRRLFRNTDTLGRHEAARLYDVTGQPLVDPNGDPVIAETPDANSLLTVGGRHFLVTHYEYDWVLGNGAPANRTEGWYSRMPMSMTLTELAQDPRTGMLSPTSQRPIDFAGVDGLWIPCFGSQMPWNTHLGSEEDYDLGHATDAQVRARIDAGTTFRDIFDITTPDRTPDWQAQDFRPVRAGHSTTEYLRLRPGMAQAAAFLETRRYAGYLGATTEFNKMEGVAVDARDRVLYLAMSYVDKGMKADPTGPADHIQVPRLNAGATYAIRTAAGQADTGGAPIASDWVGVAMQVPAALLGEDIATDALGNTAHPEKVANPDNLFFAEKMRTLFIGEDSGTHVNNFVWAYNVDTGRLSRILSLPSGAEATGLQVVENLGGHAYVMSNSQHQGEWLKSMPAEVRAGLEQAAEQRYGRSAKGVLNYYLEADVGYISGIPGL
jgi:hypothetical protein